MCWTWTEGLVILGRYRDATYEKHIASEHVMSIEHMEFSMAEDFVDKLGTCRKRAEDIVSKIMRMQHGRAFNIWA